VDHTYEATAVEFPDGRFVRSLLDDHFGGSVRSDRQALDFAQSVRMEDLEFVLNQLEILNAKADNLFGDNLDLTRVALAGHSFGGLTAFLGVEQDSRIKAGIIINGPVLEDLTPTDRPVLMLRAAGDTWSAEDRRLWEDLRGPRFAVNLRGSEYMTPSDLVWLTKGRVKTAIMGPEKTIAAVRIPRRRLGHGRKCAAPCHACELTLEKQPLREKP
jgi:pimeloyl-ACP methyl ester carboxylesterase